MLDHVFLPVSAANVLDPDGYSLEFVYKSWQH
jgi:hypothetical protein